MRLGGEAVGGKQGSGTLSVRWLELQTCSARCSQCSSLQIHRTEPFLLPNTQGRRQAFKIMCTNRNMQGKARSWPFDPQTTQSAKVAASRGSFSVFWAGNHKPCVGSALSELLSLPPTRHLANWLPSRAMSQSPPQEMASWTLEAGSLWEYWEGLCSGCERHGWWELSSNVLGAAASGNANPLPPVWHSLGNLGGLTFTQLVYISSGRPLCEACLRRDGWCVSNADAHTAFVLMALPSLCSTSWPL